ncbi:MAG: ribonuclease Y [Armatimonadota bacterium]|nr:ribonuclease Y [Armatimonadota bacterium]MCX7776481.1 ribonuclease Y [Armatimonadota bacterium]MDW8024278.1 ribonuclease Y [Armatimonadota bacterium]
MNAVTLAVSMFGFLFGALIGAIIGYVILHLQRRRSEEELKQMERRMRGAEKAKMDELIRAREELQRQRNELEQELRERRKELQRLEERVREREDLLVRKEQALDSREAELRKLEQSLRERQKEIEGMEAEYRRRLEEVAEMSSAQAKRLLLTALEEELSDEIARRVAEAEERAREEAERRAQEIVVSAMQKCAVQAATTATISVITLPSEEMKGRIIGREGRNIRAFEMLTGVDVIIDDTPETIVLSSFDPVRREIARLAMEMLIADGRIHPASIDEAVEKARQDVEAQMLKAAEAAVTEAGVDRLPQGLMKLLGRLAFRMSYGQSVLWHSVEVAILAGLMAGEIGADVEVAKRAGLLHDIGKAVDHQVDGGHVQIGAEILRRYGESEAVIKAMLSHHEDVEPESVEAVLVTLADAISASRPGARRESLEAYIRRLEAMEQIAYSFDGVHKAYAIRAGREVRVIVNPDKVSDLQLAKLARDIAKAIEQQIQHPGQVKVMVIREKRHVEYARR